MKRQFEQFTQADREFPLFEIYSSVARRLSSSVRLLTAGGC
jgi:hypothetical protein